MITYIAIVYLCDSYEFIWCMWIHVTYVGSYGLFECVLCLRIVMIYVNSHEVCVEIHMNYLNSYSICEYLEYLWVVWSRAAYDNSYIIYVNSHDGCKFVRLVWIRMVCVKSYEVCEFIWCRRARVLHVRNMIVYACGSGIHKFVWLTWVRVMIAHFLLVIWIHTMYIWARAIYMNSYDICEIFWYVWAHMMFVNSYDLCAFIWCVW